MDHGLRVARTEADDLDEVRRLRLEALALAPGAYGSTLERELAFGDADWRRRWVEGTAWLARRHGEAAGIVAAVPEAPGEVQLVAMYVRPAHRGTGAAEGLVGAVAAHARQAGARRVTLWVADGNEAARRLYARCGFTPTGRRQPLPSDPSAGEEELALHT